MQYRKLLYPLTLCAYLCLSYAMTTNPQNPRPKPHTDSLIVMSYNVENLFDTIDDVRTQDEEFTPEGEKQWTSKRYHKKLRRLAEVISRAGGLEWPCLVGLVEIENAGVLRDLMRLTPLGEKGYKYLITHSPDPRGVDVALLYREPIVQLTRHREHEVYFPSDPERKSRNILEAELSLTNGERLCVFVSHWPSRREGVRVSETFRCDVARLLRRRCDSLYRELSERERKRQHFLLMGDFNEEASEPAMRKVLRAQEYLPNNITELGDSLVLYSLMSRAVEKEHKRAYPRGSYCYQRRWSQLDHFVISESLLLQDASTKYTRHTATNFFAPSLGSKNLVGDHPSPWRSYAGNFYMGGYSDHYPIVMRLSLHKKTPD